MRCLLSSLTFLFDGIAEVSSQLLLPKSEVQMDATVVPKSALTGVAEVGTWVQSFSTTESGDVDRVKMRVAGSSRTGAWRVSLLVCRSFLTQARGWCCCCNDSNVRIVNAISFNSSIFSLFLRRRPVEIVLIGYEGTQPRFILRARKKVTR